MNEFQHRIPEQERILAVVKPPCHFVEVGSQVFRADSVPRSHNAALQEREGRLDCVGCDAKAVFVTGVFLRSVVDCFVRSDLSNGIVDSTVIGVPCVRNNYINVGAHVLADVLLQSSGLGIFGVEESQIAIALADADDNFLFCLGSFGTASAHLSADVGFIHLDYSVKLFGLCFGHCMPDSVAEIPCSPVVDSQHPLELIRRHALARLADEKHGKKPFRQRQVCIVEDRASSYGELIAA